jgi:hypothetical protein
MSQKLGDVFAQKLEESRRAEESKAIPMVFAGFPCRVRVLPRVHFIRAGRMPDHLTRKIIANVDGGAPPAPSAAQIVEGEQFFRRAVCAVLVEPPVAEQEPVPEGGYLFADLEESAPAFVRAVYDWIVADCPMPEEEKGEEVLGVADLETFPEKAGRSAGAGDKGAGGRSGAVRTDAPHRKRAGRK